MEEGTVYRLKFPAPAYRGMFFSQCCSLEMGAIVVVLSSNVFDSGHAKLLTSLGVMYMNSPTEKLELV